MEERKKAVGIKRYLLALVVLTVVVLTVVVLTVIVLNCNSFDSSSLHPIFSYSSLLFNKA